MPPAPDALPAADTLELKYLIDDYRAMDAEERVQIRTGLRYLLESCQAIDTEEAT